MKNEEQPTRLTRRSFLKRSAAAGVGAKSALIFGGLAMNSSADASGSARVCIGLREHTLQHFFWVENGNEYCWNRADCEYNYGGDDTHRSGLYECESGTEAVDCATLPLKNPNDPDLDPCVPTVHSFDPDKHLP
jgi:hypothetical protein